MSAFSTLANKLASEPGVSNPKALAASIGAKKYGKGRMALAAKKHKPVKDVKP